MIIIISLLSYFIIVIAFFGLFIVRRQIINFLICLELLLFGVNINFISASLNLNDIYGFMFSLFVLAMTAAESAVGLAILILYYKKTYILSIDKIKNVKA